MGISSQTQVGVTRREVLDAVYPAFVTGGARRREMVSVAGRSGLRPDIVRMVETLPERRYGHLRDIWADLPDLPLG